MKTNNDCGNYGNRYISLFNINVVDLFHRISPVVYTSRVSPTHMHVNTLAWNRYKMVSRTNKPNELKCSLQEVE